MVSAFNFNLSGPCFSQLKDQLEDILVSRGDVIALQHDAGPSSLLHCQSSPQSPWRQPVLGLERSEWFWINNTRLPADSSPDHDPDLLPDPELDIETLVKTGEAGWLEEVVCPVRVLYMERSTTQLQGSQLSAGLPQPGNYSLLVSHQHSMHVKDFYMQVEATKEDGTCSEEFEVLELVFFFSYNTNVARYLGFKHLRKFLAVIF